jgi:hypothetical protein
LQTYCDFYNQETLYQALGRRTPCEVFEVIHVGCQASVREKSRFRTTLLK